MQRDIHFTSHTLAVVVKVEPLLSAILVLHLRHLGDKQCKYIDQKQLITTFLLSASSRIMSISPPPPKLMPKKLCKKKQLFFLPINDQKYPLKSPSMLIQSHHSGYSRGSFSLCVRSPRCAPGLSSRRPDSLFLTRRLLQLFRSPPHPPPSLQ